MRAGHAINPSDRNKDRARALNKFLLRHGQLALALHIKVHNAIRPTTK